MRGDVVLGVKRTSILNISVVGLMLNCSRLDWLDLGRLRNINHGA